MADSELDHQDGNSFPGDPRLLLAATVVVVGSAAYLWRANLAQVSSSYLGRVAGAGDGQGVRGCAAHGDAGFRAPPDAASKPEGAGSVPDDKGAKGARSKERRRRGKDPLKDLVKGGKKLKGLAALSIPGDPADARSASTPPHLHEPPSSSHSIPPSAGPSPRRNGRLADAQAYIDSRPDGATDDEDAMCSSVSGLSSCPTEASSSRVRATSRAREDVESTATPSSNTRTPHEDRAPHDDHDPVSISSSASHSSTASLSSFSDSADTVDTSTTSVSEYVSTPKAGTDRPSSGVFDESNSTVFDRSGSSSSASALNGAGVASSSNKAASSSTKLQFPGPWDPDPDDARDPRKSSPSKPLRKRSRSRGPLDPSSPSRPSGSSSRPSGSRHGSEAPAHSAAAAHGRPLDGSRGAEHAVTPTTPGPASGLPTPGASSASTSYSAPTAGPHPASSSGSYPSSTSGPQPPGSHLPTTPGAYSEPSVCLQTQVASLRGALEASRMREENMRGEMERQSREMREMEQRSREMESRTREWERQRGEMERQSKDVEMLRWESAHWRRREMELQSQIHHLMQQLQYSTMMASNSARVRGSASNGSNSPAPSTGPTSPAFSGPPPMSMFSPPIMPSMPSSSGMPNGMMPSPSGMVPSPNGMVPSPSGMVPSPGGMMPSSSGPFSPVLPPHMQQAPPLSMMSPTMQGSPRSPYSYMPDQGQPYSPSQMRPYSPSQMRPYSPMASAYPSTGSIPQSQSHSELLAVFPSSAPRAGGSSGPPSVGSSSRGSASPELAASGSTASSSHNLTSSSSQSSLGMDRGRQRTRPGYDGEYDEGAADEYSGVLADAILKRPQAMRVGSRQAIEEGASRESSSREGELAASREGQNGPSREGDAPEAADRREAVDLRESPEEEIVEFSFPSISDYREPPRPRDEPGPDEVAA